jgi:hypothetical protein
VTKVDRYVFTCSYLKAWPTRRDDGGVVIYCESCRAHLRWRAARVLDGSNLQLEVPKEREVYLYPVVVAAEKSKEVGKRVMTWGVTISAAAIVAARLI